MGRSVFLVAMAAALSSCGQGGGDNQAANQANTAAAPAAKKHPTYCFFPDPADNKGWTVKTDKDGNVTVSGKAHYEDRRYMARLSQSDITGATASVWLTATTNTTGMGAQDNWWDVDTTIPNSANVTEVKVMCGKHVFADLQVPRKAAPAAPASKP
jgi:hypothetical protein